MYGRLNSYEFDRVNSYAEAIDYWSRSLTIRGQTNKRRLKAKSHQNKWVSKDDDNAISFCWGGADAVTWHNENKFTLEVGDRQNWANFVNVFLPVNMELQHNMPGPFVKVDRLEGGPICWRAPLRRLMTFVRPSGRTVWQPSVAPPPFEYPAYNPDKARAVLVEAGFNEFRDYAKAYFAMGAWKSIHGMSDPRMTTLGAMMGRKQSTGVKVVYDAFCNRERWEELLTSPSLTGYTSDPKIAQSRVLAGVRLAIIIQHEAVTWRQFPYVDGHGTLDGLHRAKLEYGAWLRPRQ